ncbi:DoxX family protein [Edaphobacter bradus]|uniref:DoxX family protein n=1 Tax=Edaphobacter bradus TaxID=2259016 RepID=UPI0021DFC15E|nr:DoxX family protein [Edaphobacter bradus]
MKSLFAQLNTLHAAFCSIAEKLCSPLLLFIRLYWGWQFAQTGWGKLQNQARVVDFFTSLNIPFPAFNAHFVSGLEFVGGILLIVGLFSRPIAFLLTGSMFVAFWTAEREAFLSIFSNSDKFYKADAYTFLFASIMILAFGPGLFSLDALLSRWLFTSEAVVQNHADHRESNAVTG